ncbi:alanine racemase [Lapidilactobacillus concavus DSM 17758]|uniref:Alanine racemase n=1 Tax=Lapidilactobacillus concavus DSM 17758 TaxID=1423735 RepID=A0A0R1VYP0_9LACO|nr:alanine racemase [Lapidilactobacillus concavus]KRM08660.1 alanine racemase [Lapidilactobacillus concavus DSM 17758]GEL13119.1 alanine racemase [Lapidilactobacillus concavus]
MQTSFLRPTYIEIDQQAIYHNVFETAKRLHDDAELFAVVKADAYGHGLVPVARVCREAGATGFCVATIDEAMALRSAQITEPILVLGISSPQTVAIAAAQHISLTFGDLDWLKEATRYLEQTANLPALNLHVALDTGMGRIGFTDQNQLATAVTQLRQSKEFNFEGIFTHFSTADERETTYFEQQLAKFNAMMSVVGERPHYVHVANSATSLWHQVCHANMIRFGIGIYGLNPSGNQLQLPYELEPALSLYSELVFVKHVQAGTAISYGATYHATQDEWIGTIPIGYADGWLRRLSGMPVLINGQRCPIVGRVCMDQIMVRLPEQLAVGTKVTLIGRDGVDEITAQEVAEYSQTIHYEITCGLQDRIPRHYLPKREELD